MICYYSDIGEMEELIDFFIWYYGESSSYDAADERFSIAIEPFLEKMTANQIVEIMRVTNTNNQIYNRGKACNANNKIVRYARNVLIDDFDFKQYPRFKFDEEIIKPFGSDEVSLVDEGNSGFDDCPF